MPKVLVTYVRLVDRFNRIVGRAAMYLVFVMIGVLFWSVISKELRMPAIWTLDVSQFLMVAYFILGGAYAMQQDGHVRMDLFYGNWQSRRQAKMDVATTPFLIFYIVLLLVGAVASTIYAFEFGERGFSAWRPVMWPIKVIMTIGITMMLAQAVAELLRAIAAARGTPIQ